MTTRSNFADRKQNRKQGAQERAEKRAKLSTSQQIGLLETQRPGNSKKEINRLSAQRRKES